MNVNLTTFYVVFFIYRSSSGMKCAVSGTKRQIAFKNNIPLTLNPTLNLTDSVNRCQHENFLFAILDRNLM